MTVPANSRRDRYVASGGQTVFPYTFRVFAAGDLVVERMRAGVTTTLTLTTDYAVSGVGNDAGGNVTLTAASLAGDVLAIVSAQPDQRTTDFTESGDFRAAAVNAEFDRIWIGIQQLQQELRRQLTAPVSDAIGLSYRLPPQAERAGKLLGFDGTGQPTLATGAAIGGVSISALGGQIIGAATEAAVRTLISAASSGDVAAEAAARTAAIAAESAARAAAIAAETAERNAAIAQLSLRQFFQSAPIPLVWNSSWNVTHGLTARPIVVLPVFRCIENDGFYVVGEEAPPGVRGPTPIGFQWAASATTIRGVFPDNLSPAPITASRWQLIVRAWL